MKRTISYTLQITQSQRTPYVMGFIVFCLLSAYVFFANSAVRNVTRLEQSKNVMQSLRVQVSELEASQFIAQNTVNKDAANRIGLVDVENPIYILREDGHSSLSLKR